MSQKYLTSANHEKFIDIVNTKLDIAEEFFNVQNNVIVKFANL